MSTLIIDKVYENQEESENPFSPKKALFHEADPIVEVYKHGIPPKDIYLDYNTKESNANGHANENLKLININGDNTLIHKNLNSPEEHNLCNSDKTLSPAKNQIKNLLPSPDQGMSSVPLTPNGYANGDLSFDKKECIAEAIIVPPSDTCSMGKVKVETVVLTKKGEIRNGGNSKHAYTPQKHSKSKCCNVCVIS